jgi:hypothetical protein
MEASFASYSEFAPADATERILATLSTGLTNAAMTSLQHAAHTTLLPARSEELKNATQASQVVMELLEARDRHRGRGKQTVAVGQVTVESGGQAIVGTVNSEASFKPANTEKAAKETPSQENTAIPRGTRKVG